MQVACDWWVKKKQASEYYVSDDLNFVKMIWNDSIFSGFVWAYTAC